MKKILEMLTIMVFLVAFASCEKDPPITPIDPTPTTTIDVVGKTQVKSGDSTMLTTKVTNVSSGLILTCTPAVYKGGVKITVINLTGNETEEDLSFSTGPLSETTTFFFRITKDLKVVVSREITVVVEATHPPTLKVSFLYEGDTVTEMPYGGGKVNLVCHFTNGTLYFEDLPYYNPAGVKVFEDIEITETKTFFFKVIGVDGEISKELTVLVSMVPPIPTLADTLCNVTRTLVKLEFQDGPGLPWYEVELDECLRDNKSTFYLDFTTTYDEGTISCSPYPPTINTGTWVLNGRVVKIDNVMDNLLITLTHDTLVWVYHAGGQLDATRETYVYVPTNNLPNPFLIPQTIKSQGNSLY